MKFLAKTILSIIIGCVAFIAATYALSLLFGLILQIPIISWVLSYPSSSKLWAGITINSGSVALSLVACNWLCPKNAHGKKVGVILLSIGLLGIGIFSCWSIFVLHGFSDEFIGILSGTALAGLAIYSESTHNDKAMV